MLERKDIERYERNARRILEALDRGKATIDWKAIDEPELIRAEEEERWAQEQDAKKTEAVGKQKIGQTKAIALHRLFIDKKVDEAKILVLYKVEKLEDLTEIQHANIWAHIDQIVERYSV